MPHPACATHQLLSSKPIVPAPASSLQQPSLPSTQAQAALRDSSAAFPPVPPSTVHCIGLAGVSCLACPATFPLCSLLGPLRLLLFPIIYPLNCLSSPHHPNNHNFLLFYLPATFLAILDSATRSPTDHPLALLSTPLSDYYSTLPRSSSTTSHTHVSLRLD